MSQVQLPDSADQTVSVPLTSFRLLPVSVLTSMAASMCALTPSYYLAAVTGGRRLYEPDSGLPPIEDWKTTFQSILLHGLELSREPLDLAVKTSLCQLLLLLSHHFSLCEDNALQPEVH